MLQPVVLLNTLNIIALEHPLVAAYQMQFRGTGLMFTTEKTVSLTTSGCIGY